MTTAKIITHSVSPAGKELISIEATNVKYIDAEICKHGMLSSNSSSDRAIPYKIMRDAEYFIPTDIRINGKGMQNIEQVKTEDLPLVQEIIKRIRQNVLIDLDVLANEYNLHKQTLNRYLLPWSMQKKILTGTREAWNAVMRLRDHEDADPSIQIWAKAIQVILNTSKPTLLKNGEWHLPYVLDGEKEAYPIETLLRTSAARCARTSYNLNSTGKISDTRSDMNLFGMLVGGEIKHETPLCHQAKPAEQLNQDPNTWERGITHMMRDGTFCSGALQGFVQFRHWYNYG